MMTHKDDLSELATVIVSAVEKARHLKLPTTSYILSMALMEVMEERDAVGAHPNDDTTR
jgi:hypothetical protein